MSEGLKIAFELLGGLALFIYSMNMMSQGLQNMAGEKMRYVLSVLTKSSCRCISWCISYMCITKF